MIGKLNKKDILALSYITLLSIIAVVYGFSIVPSPLKEHILATDQKRVDDLGEIQSAVTNYYQTNNMLPPSLDVLKTQPYDPSTPLEKTDPETHKPYEYRTTGSYFYQLCATFAMDSSKEQPTQDDTTIANYASYNGDFTHPAGHFCFTEREQSNGPLTHPSIFPCQAGRMCPMMPASKNSASPSAIVSSFDKNGNCQWTPTFYLTGFVPNSQIRVYWEGTLSDSCTTKPNQKETSSTLLNQQTDANGDILVGYPDTQIDYGEYNYTFTDSEGHSALLHVTYDGNAQPIVSPSSPSQ